MGNTLTVGFFVLFSLHCTAPQDGPREARRARPHQHARPRQQVDGDEEGCVVSLPTAFRGKNRPFFAHAFVPFPLLFSSLSSLFFALCRRCWQAQLGHAGGRAHGAHCARRGSECNVTNRLFSLAFTHIALLPSVRIPTTRTRTTSKNRPGLQVSPTCVIAFRSRPSHLRRVARRQRALRGSAPPARRARERQTRASSRRRKSRAL